MTHPALIQASLTLPTRPHAIFRTLQGTQNRNTKPTLQRAKNANAQPSYPGGRISIIICSTLQQFIYAQYPSPPITQLTENVFTQLSYHSCNIHTFE